MKYIVAISLLSITVVQGQVAYDPHSIPGWGRGQACDTFVLSPYDIVLDSLNSDVMPNQFRSPTFIKPSTTQAVNLTGFNALRMSGSGQYAKGQLKQMFIHLKRSHNVNPENIIVVDLREEPHGYINGHAITWYYGPLSYQYGKTPNQVLADERQRVTFVKSEPYATIYTIKKHRDGMPFNKTPRLEKVEDVQNEEQAVTELGARYVRLPVTDHFRPEDKDVDQFLELIAQLKSNDWLHLKCRGGRGRTTTFMAIYDMIKNPNIKKEDVVGRQTFLGGTDLKRVTKAQHYWKKKLNYDRVHFIDTFYDYVHAKDGYGKMKWSDWVTKHDLDHVEINAPLPLD
jgi:protein-tyrosine phosphatase